mmetsp:Transcript_69596/g.176560  ORF Transcript_69596/g.176560 Transcript_69596/m.176560 type:complete len:509 (+) Transcript_69596:364-1890(+)
MLDAGHIEPTCSNISCDKHIASACAESRERGLTLRLRAVAMDVLGGHGGKALVGRCIRRPATLQHFLEPCGASLLLHEDECTPAPLTQGGNHKCELLPLVRLRKHDALGDGTDGAANTADSDADKGPQESLGEVLDLGGECGGEQECLPRLLGGHLSDEPADLWLETHIEHAIGLIENKESRPLERDKPAPHEVVKPPRRRHHHVATDRECTSLPTLVGTSVDTDVAQRRAVGQLLCLKVDLAGELTRWRHHDCTRSCSTSRADGRPACTGCRERGADRYEERSRLARAGLRTAHEVATGECERHGVLLDGRRRRVAHQPEVAREEGRQLRAEGAKVGERLHVLGARARDIDFGPLLAELDSLRALLGEKLGLASVRLGANHALLCRFRLAAAECLLLTLAEVVGLGIGLDLHGVELLLPSPHLFLLARRLRLPGARRRCCAPPSILRPAAAAVSAAAAAAATAGRPTAFAFAFTSTSPSLALKAWSAHPTAVAVVRQVSLAPLLAMD